MKSFVYHFIISVPLLVGVCKAGLGSLSFSCLSPGSFWLVNQFFSLCHFTECFWTWIFRQFKCILLCVFYYFLCVVLKLYFRFAILLLFVTQKLMVLNQIFWVWVLFSKASETGDMTEILWMNFCEPCIYQWCLSFSQFSSYHVYMLATLWVEPISDENVGL